MKHNNMNLAFLLIIIFSFSCANPKPPSGGPQDTIKPKVIQFSPKNLQTNFEGDRIYLRFNKWMERNSVINNISINPPVKYDLDWSGRSLNVIFREKLDSNVTYYFLIAPEIVDIDGNSAESPFSLIFTCGSKVDSGKIIGRILEKDLKNVYIYAIPWDKFSDTVYKIEDLFHYKVTPNANGEFQFQALKNNHYLLIAYIDKNNSKIFDLDIDYLGIAPKLYKAIPHPKDTFYVILRPPQDKQQPSIIDIDVKSGNHIDLIFDESIRVDTGLLSNIKFVKDEDIVAFPNYAIISSFRPEVCQLFFRTALDSGEFLLDISNPNVCVDFAGNTLCYLRKIKLRNNKGFDTTNIRFLKPESPIKASLLEKDVRFAFSKPIDSEKTKGLSVLAINKVTKDTFSQRFIYDKFGISIETKNFRTAGLYQIEINADTLYDFVGNRFVNFKDSLILDLIPKTAFGSFRGLFRNTNVTTKKNYVAMLRNVSDLFYSVIKDGKWNFDQIPEGEYILIIFEDSNGNGKYDYGQLSPLFFSEEIVKYLKPVQMQKGWSIEEINLWK